MEELHNRYMCLESPEAVTLLAEINADCDIWDMMTQASARSLEYYRSLTTALGGRPYNSALPTSGECEDDPLLPALREFGGCAHCYTGKLKCREQDRASLRRRGCVQSGTAEE